MDQGGSAVSRWFRHYSGMMRDEKLVRVAVRSGQPIERVLWVWGAILESAAEINDNGRYDFEAAEAAYFLRASEADILAIETGLADAGHLDAGRVVKWGDRQYQSDKSATRQAAYRERKRQEQHDDSLAGKRLRDDQSEKRDVTRPSRDAEVTPPKTDTDTERTSLLNGRERELYDALGDHANQRVNGRFIALSEPINWLASGCDLDADVIPTVRAMATRATRPITTWGYFTAAVIEARDRRLAPAPPVQARAAAPPGRHPRRESPLDVAERIAARERTKAEIPSRAVELLPANGSGP